MKWKLALLFSVSALLTCLNQKDLKATQLPDTPSHGVEAITDFTGGLYTNSVGREVPATYGTAIRNCYIDNKIGSIIKANGWIVLGSNPAIKIWKGIWDLSLENGTVDFLVFGSTVDPPTSTSGVIYLTVDFNSYTTIRSALNATLDLNSVQVRNSRWFTNGSDSVFEVNATSATVLDGTLNTPSVPKCQFIEYFQNRVFIYNSAANNSALYFCELVDTSPAHLPIPPDNPTAWPATDQLNIDQGNGQPGSFLKVFNRQLQMGKSNAIYTLYGTGASNYQFRKTKANIGFISQKSVVELDNLLYGQAIDGFYSFDGENTQRLSDTIADKMAVIRTDTSRILTNTWDTYTDFSRGTIFNATVTPSGFIQLASSISYINTTNGLPSGGFDLRLQYQTSSAWGTFSTTQPIIANSYALSALQFWVNNPDWYTGSCTGGANSNIIACVKNVGSGISTCTALSESIGGGSYRLITADFSSLLSTFSVVDLSNGNMQFRIENTTGNNCSLLLFVPTTTVHSTIQVSAKATSGTFISDITTVTTVNAWQSFNATQNISSGTITYYVRSGTSVVTITTNPWTIISPGATPSFPTTNLLFQWASTISIQSPDISNLNNIDLVSLSHVEGAGSDTRAFSVPWLGRWWMGVSTESTGKFPLIYVKSKISNKNPNAWVEFDGIPAKQFLSLNNILYAVSGSSGIVMRLDYGTSYNGNAFTAYYETADMVLGDDFTFKDLWECILDAEKQSGQIIKVGFSLDGNSFNYINVNADGSGPLRYSIRNPNAGFTTYCKQVKIHFENNQLDKGMTVNSWATIFKPTKIR